MAQNSKCPNRSAVRAFWYEKIKPLRESEREISQLRAFLYGSRKPIRLTAASSPGLARIVAIAVLHSDFAALAASATKNLGDGNAALGGKCHDFGLELVLLADFRAANCFLDTKFEILKFLE